MLLVIISFSTLSEAGNIVYPWRATTAIVKSGETFEVWFNADQGETVKSVQLVGPYSTMGARIKIKKASWVYDVTSMNTYNTNITVSVPANCPADRYDIVLNTSSGLVRSLAGAKVIKGYKPSYYILHFSDAHAFQKGSETVLNRISTIVEMANIINPELVFNTGDNLYRPTEDRMNQLFAGNAGQSTKGLNSLNAATFTVPGNHDYDFDKLAEKGFYKEKSDWWNTWWGLQTYHFKYDNARFMVTNNGWDGFNPVQQIAATNAWLQKVGKGNFRLSAAHIRDKEMKAFDSIVPLEFALFGHNHHIASQNPSLLSNKPIQYIVNSIRDHMEFNLYKVDGKAGTCVPVGSKTGQVVYVENPTDQETPSLYKPKLTLRFLKANDGSSTSNIAYFVNKFDFPIEGAKVRFIMPKAKKYTVSKGKIEQEFDGRKVHVVDVSVNLQAGSSLEVTIHAKE
ncbi:MAG: metallophosphoesterase [Bacteroidia bacterium]|nr:metallophosphoesterase [Bacteroidia bacterium]